MSPRLPFAILLLAIPVAAQSAAARNGSAEQQDLEHALSAAGASPVEYLRAIESHLAKYPKTARRAELESAAARAAIDAGNGRAIVEYGERVLARRPDDLTILEAVARTLAAGDSQDAWQRALRYAHRSEDLLTQQRNDASRAGRAASPAVQDQIDRELAGALLAEAAASGKLGHPADALAAAHRAYEIFPGVAAAQEEAHWHEQLGQPLDAARDLADAITVPDSRASIDERARDRARMDELYRQAKGSSAGEGDLLLDSFDRYVALVHARQLRLRAGDPNALIEDPMQFTITGLDASKLPLATLEGKVVVMDFWATWCVPCREQHPLLEKVRKQFAGSPDVVFLSINTDDDRAPVTSFLQQQHWDDRVYFDDGLSRKLSVLSLPTTIVFDRSGKVFSRLTGFVAAQYVKTLSERIAAAAIVP